MKENKFRVYCEIEFEGKITKCMESPASWFLLTQAGTLLSYGTLEAPQPLGKKYKKAIALFYAGLKDKNETEIYEGDIIKSTLNETKIGIMEFKKGRFQISFKNRSMLFCHENRKSLEVLGNIYENPELLEEK